VVVELHHPLNLATESVAAQWAALWALLWELRGGASVTDSAVAQTKARLKAGAAETLFGGSSQSKAHRDSGNDTQFGGGGQSKAHRGSRNDTQFGGGGQSKAHRGSGKDTQFGGKNATHSGSKSRKHPQVLLRHSASESALIGSYEEKALVVQSTGSGNKGFFDSTTWNPSGNNKFKINLSKLINKLPTNKLISLAKHGGRQVPGPDTTFVHIAYRPGTTSFGTFSITAVEE
jgi:hypothetical protein